MPQGEKDTHGILNLETEDCPPLRKLYVYQTNRCNSRCKHCWVDASPFNKDSLAAEQVIPVIDRAIALGLKTVKVTGGEPFILKKPLFEIMKHAASLGLETKLETNATLVNDETASLLSSLNSSVYVSLDGSSPESHDPFRRKGGSFYRTLAGIEKLTRHQVRVGVISCLHPGNLREVDEIADLCFSLGVVGLKFNFPSPYGRGRELRAEARLLKIEQVLETAKYLETTHFSRSLEIDLDLPRIFRSYPLQGPRCDVLNILSILSDGRYSLCGIGATHPELTFGRINRDDLEELWKENETLKNMRRTIPYSPRGICSRCTEYHLCFGHCLAYSVEEYSSLNGPFPLCQEAFEKGLFPEEKLLKLPIKELEKSGK